MQNYTNIERVKRKMEYSVKEKKFIDKRNYGIDALRLISMLGVVALHVLGRGGSSCKCSWKKIHSLLVFRMPGVLRSKLLWNNKRLCLLFRRKKEISL